MNLNIFGMEYEMLDEKLSKHIELLVQRYPVLEGVKSTIEKGYALLERCFEGGGKVLIGGKDRKSVV